MSSATQPSQTSPDANGGGGLFSTSARGIFRRTLPAPEPKSNTFARELGLLPLVMIGVGAIIGAGVFSLAGEVAKDAGPAVLISFLIAGAASLIAAFAYAEFSSIVPRAGSSYTYGAATLGEVVGWMIGWDLILEYTAIVALVAVSMAGYFNALLGEFGLHLPAWASGSAIDSASPAGAVVNLPAVVIVLLVGLMLSRGTKSSARVETVLTLLKIGVILLVVIAGAFFVDPGHWTPFFPSWTAMFAGASTVFFAVFGYDALSTAAEESKSSRTLMPKAMMWALGIAMLLYVMVCLVLTGMIFYPEIVGESALASAFSAKGLPVLSIVISIGAILGIFTVCFTFMMAVSRLGYSLSRDGLLPSFLGHLDDRRRVPNRAIWLFTVLAALLAAFVPIIELTHLVNIGVLAAFLVVTIAVVVLRYRKPHLEREFRMPWVPVLPILGALFSIALIVFLTIESTVPLVRFLVWMVIGLVIYATYGYHRTRRVMPGGSVAIEEVNKMDDGS